MDTVHERDRQTDGRTDGQNYDHKDRASHGKNGYLLFCTTWYLTILFDTKREMVTLPITTNTLASPCIISSVKISSVISAGDKTNPSVIFACKPHKNR